MLQFFLQYYLPTSQYFFGKCNDSIEFTYLKVRKYVHKIHEGLYVVYVCAFINSACNGK